MEDEDAVVSLLDEKFPEGKMAGPIDGLPIPVESGALEDTEEMLIVVGTEGASDGAETKSTWLLEFAPEFRSVEVRVRNSVDLVVVVALLDKGVGIEADAGEELVAITAITLMFEELPLVGDDDTAGADEYGEYPP